MKEYDFKLTQEDLNVIAAGLGELKLKASLGVFNKLRNQFEAQNAGEETENELKAGS